MRPIPGAGAVIQARMGSTRFPGKVLADLVGRPLLGRVVDRVRRARTLSWVGVATTTDPGDDPVVRFCKAEDIPCQRGSIEDVLGRYVAAARAWDLDPVVRITGDCPFVCPETIDAMVTLLASEKADYATYSLPTVHEGIDAFSLRWLCQADDWPLPSDEREHLALLVKRHLDTIQIAETAPPPGVEHRPGLRFSVDEPADLEFARAVYTALRHKGPCFSTMDLLALLDAQPDLPLINAGVQRTVPIGIR